MGVVGVAPALPAASCWSDSVQTRSLALHDVAAAKGTRFARVIGDSNVPTSEVAEVPILSQYSLPSLSFNKRLFVLWDRISLCSPGWSWKSEICLLLLGLKVCATTTQLWGLSWGHGGGVNSPGFV